MRYSNRRQRVARPKHSTSLKHDRNINQSTKTSTSISASQRNAPLLIGTNIHGEVNRTEVAVAVVSKTVLLEGVGPGPSGKDLGLALDLFFLSRYVMSVEACRSVWDAASRRGVPAKPTRVMIVNRSRLRQGA